MEAARAGTNDAGRNNMNPTRLYTTSEASQPSDQAPKPSREVPNTGTSRTVQALDGADPTQDRGVAKRLRQMPRKYRSAYRRVVTGKAPRMTAIHLQCLECCGWQREEVRLCTARGCPLFKYRPYQHSPE
jgi:hypothetical protein